jgi:hypothetical protein
MARKADTYQVLSRSIGALSRRGGTRARVALAAGMMSAGVLTSVVGFGLGTSSAAASPKATAAKTITLNETGRLHRTGSSGLKLNEQGAASGTIKGTIYIHLDVVSPNRVTAEVSIYPSGGSLTGSGTASYHVSGGTASFAGTMSISRGTGTYAGAHGSGLSFGGTIQRLSGAVTVHVSGKLST